VKDPDQKTAKDRGIVAAEAVIEIKGLVLALDTDAVLQGHETVADVDTGVALIHDHHIVEQGRLS